MAKPKKHSIYLIEEHQESIDPILHKTLTYNLAGEIIEELVYFPDGNIQEKHEIIFNEKGFISSEKIYLEGDELDYLSTYEYEGDAVVKITEKYSEPEENQTRIFEYPERMEKMTVYGSENEILSIEIRGVDAEDRILWEEIRDENNEIIARQEFDYTSFGEYKEVREFAGEVKRVRKYTYNDKNWLLNMLVLEENEVIARLSYEYDENGNPLVEINESANGTYRTENQYNEQNNIKSSKTFGPNELLLEAYDFEYNEHGLVVQESFFRLDPYLDEAQEGKFAHSYEYFA